MAINTHCRFAPEFVPAGPHHGKGAFKEKGVGEAFFKPLSNKTSLNTLNSLRTETRLQLGLEQRSPGLPGREEEVCCTRTYGAHTRSTPLWDSADRFHANYCGVSYGEMLRRLRHRSNPVTA